MEDNHTSEHYEFEDLTRFDIDPEMIAKLPEDLCRSHEVVLLGRVPKSDAELVPLGMTDIHDDQVITTIEKRIPWKLRRIQLNADELDLVLEHAFGTEKLKLPKSISLANSRERINLSYDRHISFDRDQEAPRMVVDAFSEAVRRRASDIHIEVFHNDVDLRFRIDGVLQQVVTPFSRKNIGKVITHLKVLSDLDIAQHRLPQDGRIGTIYTDSNGESRQIDMRIAILPGVHGEEAVLRILDARRIMHGLSELGMPDRIYDRFQRVLHAPSGIILVTGPTASGKTTTLYAAIRELNNDTNKILTVEDPVEYTIPKVNQKQVNSIMSFADYSRAFIRQDPDIVMIGEVRDEETASIALRAAQTGNLVLTTLHTRNALSSVLRLMTLGADRSLVASGLLCVLSQRIFRKNCPDCSEPYRPDKQTLSRLHRKPSSSAEFKKGKGCETCFHSGYLGQTGVFELIVLTDEMRNRITRGEDITHDQMPDFISMFEDALNKAENGITTVDEVLRAVPLPDLLY